MSASFVFVDLCGVILITDLFIVSGFSLLCSLV